MILNAIGLLEFSAQGRWPVSSVCSGGTPGWNEIEIEFIFVRRRFVTVAGSWSEFSVDTSRYNAATFPDRITSEFLKTAVQLAFLLTNAALPTAPYAAALRGCRVRPVKPGTGRVWKGWTRGER